MTSHEQIIARLWQPETVRALAHQMADIAADALTVPHQHVRKPGPVKLPKGDIATVVREIEQRSLQLSHPRYIAQQVAAPIPAAALVESVVGALNQSCAVWEMSPVATAIDRDLMARFKKLFGFPKDADGSMVPGGAYGNLTALLAARDALTKPGHRIAFIAGAQTHYSVSRSAAILGLGRDAVFTVPTDAEYRTDATRVRDAFKAARKAGFTRFALVASCGSTPTGSFDDLVALREIADREKAWLHVDAAHGAGLLFSKRYRKLLSGIAQADSVTFDPHKMMFVPLAAGCVLVRDGARLRAPLADNAPYLFGSERPWPDVGQLTIACSQRFDALKVWLPWSVYGPSVWDALVTHTCDVCQQAYRLACKSKTLEPAHKPHSNILCVRLRNGGDQLHWDIKEQLNESGHGYLSSAVVGGRRVLRMVIMNPRTQLADVESVFAKVEELARRAG